MAATLYVRPSRWKKNLMIVAGMGIAAHVVIPPEDATGVLGLVVGGIIILLDELRYRSGLMDLMDIQLIEVSATVDRMAHLETQVRELREAVEDIKLGATRR